LDKKIRLEVVGFSKHFGGIKAIDNIDLQLYDNEILGIVGDNGAGKSTLVKCISGVYKQNSGKIFVSGEEAVINNPTDAKKYGIETVYQDQSLIHTFDTVSNLFLGRETTSNNFLGRLFGVFDSKYMRKEAEGLLGKFHIKIKDLSAPVSYLSGGQRQAVVVGRSVYWGKKIVILDEPTNNLGVQEQKDTIKLIKQLRDEYNMSIIIISHNLYHIFELVDRIFVLKNGEVVGERVKNETTTHEIVSMISSVAV